MKYYREDSCRDGDAIYYCKLCEEEGGIVATSTEIKIIRHIQTSHPELHLIVNIDPGDPGSDELREKLVKKGVGETELDVNRNRNSDYKDITISQEDSFFPCDRDDCSDIFLSLAEFRKHKLSHKEKDEAVQVKVKNKVKRSNFRVRIQNKKRDKRIVPEYRCPICPKAYQNSQEGKHGTFKNHVLSHFYSVFYPHLPSSKPFKCSVCQLPHRDRITMIRHYAFGHKKFYEFTNVTPEELYYI